ncbi:hypothetical protein [Ornithinibacillus scapharcae]|uniref:hypothetical protein n=1 Tax=Ornithinibacillus scapharcae TaxID=1147159 RepID=UPI000225C01B|nr:hypothetical protein [Ornithinibacillus scapharcae]
MLLKRLWKLITLTIVIVAVLVTYFVYTSLVVAKQFPEVVIENIKGDEEFIKDVTVSGDYYQDNEIYMSAFMVSTKGSKYRSNLSFIEDLNPNFPPDEVSTLQKDYKRFMRGKWNIPGYYFQNDEYLAYAVAKTDEWNGVNNPEYYFEVEVLTKETNETNSFTIDIPDRENFYNVQVVDVQVFNGEVKVVTQIGYYTTNQRYEYEIKVYAIDMKNGKITSDETIGRDEKGQENSDEGSGYSLLNDFGNISEQKHLIVQKEDQREVKVTTEDNMESVETQTVDRTFFVYDLESNERQELTLSKEIQKEIMSLDYLVAASSVDGYVYLTFIVNGDLSIVGYDLENGNEEIEYRINLEKFGMEEPRVLKIKDKRFYLSDYQLTNESSAKVIVGDITTGKVLYEGEIVLKDAKFKSEKDRLELTNIVIN